MTETLGECKNCKQGYTRDGRNAYPDVIWLCPFHSATEDLLKAAKASLVIVEEYGNKETIESLKAAISKSSPGKE